MQERRWNLLRRGEGKEGIKSRQCPPGKILSKYITYMYRNVSVKPILLTSKVMKILNIILRQVCKPPSQPCHLGCFSSCG